MADIISREKAIETIQYRVCQGHGNKEHICKRGSCAYCGIMEIINDIENIEAADVQPVDRWISVEDRLPQEGGFYLTYYAAHVHVSQWFISENWYNEHGGNVTHNVEYWQPLPEPPETIKG